MEEELKARVEAALYASGRPLSPEELAKAAGIRSKRKAVAIARSVARNFNTFCKAIEVVEMSDKSFVMQLKNQYLRVAKMFANKPLLSNSALKTLSYIAYYQPVTALELAEKRGSHVYQHLKELERLNLVASEPSGRTKSYRTTTTFSSMLGLSHNVDVLKKQLRTMLTKLEKVR